MIRGLPASVFDRAISPAADIETRIGSSIRSGYCQSEARASMYWLILVISLFPLLGFLVLGCFLLVSAVTGRGMTPPAPDEPWVVHLRYRLRGIIGLVFTYVAATSLWKLIVLGLRDLQ